MRNYMTALHRRFHNKSERTVELGHEVEGAYDALHDTLSIDQQKLLLRFLDAEEHFRDEEKLDAFVSGFKLRTASSASSARRTPTRRRTKRGHGRSSRGS